ncbi:MAG: DUF6443 domain-containing protein, partial [Prevotellaceae bacterium]|nr:DUF6443 domain-containing protein [Prevotellaceae bacterium]
MNKKVLPLSLSRLLVARNMLLCFMLLCLPGTVNGKSKEYTDNLQGSAIQNDNWEFVSADKAEYGNTKKRIRHIFMLHIPNPAGVEVSATVDLSIAYSRLGTNTTETATPALSIHYTADNTTSRDRAVFLLDDALISSCASSFTGDIPPGVELKYIAQVEWVEPFSRDLIPGSLNISQDPVTGEYKVTWGAITAAEEYHLEWVHVNNYSDQPGQETFLEYDFDKNATRISTHENSYSISPVFDKGYLLCRVRSIGYDDLDKKFPVASRWSCEPDGCSARISTPLPSFAIKTLAHTGDRLNWQYITSYAEAGKKKEVVTYYDGTMRSQQAVTRLNTDSISIVGETYYDHQGRAAIQSLPVPGGRSTLNFHPDFNVSAVRTNSVYSRLDFDLDSSEDMDPDDPGCKITVNAMLKDSGAARYYSDKNPDKERGFNKYIPQAGANEAGYYPFSQTEYEPDNTGRIRRQGGVGADYQLGARPGHETGYFYGKPSQEELNRLFGSEAGHSSHYRKNVVRDANGQLSVTYLDMHGRTVATALSGNPATGLQALSSNLEARQKSTTVCIIDNQPVASYGSNYLSTYHHLVTTRGDHKFEYTLPAIRVIDEDGLLPPNTCLDSLFVLTIDIRDECGARPALKDQSFPDNVPVTTLPITHTIGSVGNSCAQESDITLKFTAHDLATGKYTISRELTLNKKRYEKTDLDYLLTQKLDTVIRRKISEIDFSQCFVPKTCFEHCLSSGNMDSCMADCSYTDECEQKKVMLASDYIPGRSVPDNVQFNGELNGGGSQVMGGQYALYEVSPVTGRYTYSSDPHSIFFPETFSHLKEYFPHFFFTRDHVEIHKDSIHDFISNFRDEYAETLALAFHPEKACLEACQIPAVDESARYAHLMRITETYEEAYSLGLLNPMGISAAGKNYPPNRLPDNYPAIDPFFEGLPRRNFLRFRLLPSFPHLSLEVVQLQNEMKTEMEEYLTHRKDFPDPLNETRVFRGNIWEQAVCAAIRSNTPDMNEDLIMEKVREFDFTALESSSTDYLCNRDRVWEFFRALYLAKRNEIEMSLGEECDSEVPEGKIRRFVRKEDTFTGMDNRIKEITSEEEIQGQTQDIESQVEQECLKQAMAQAENCLEHLSGCLRLNNPAASDTQWQLNQGNEQYNSLYSAFTYIMTQSCLITGGGKMFGATSLPADADVPQGQYRSFEEAMEAILVSGTDREFTLECNPYLISFPMEYTHEDNSNTGYKKIDTCACNLLMENDARFYRLKRDNALPQNITSARRLFEKETGKAVDNYQAKVCLCRKAYRNDEWSQQTPWTEEGRQELEDSNEYISIHFTCDVCVDCQLIQQWETAFRTSYVWLTRILSGYPQELDYLRKQMLTNFLNNKLNLKKTYPDYEEFLSRCNATDAQPYCELSEQAKKLEDLLNDVAGKGPMTGNQCDISEPVGELQKSLGIDHTANNCRCSSYTYQPAVNGQVLTMQASGQGCNNIDCPVTLEFVNDSAGYVFKSIVPFFGNIRPAPAPANALPGRYYFYIDASIVHHGAVVRDSMLGSACFPIEICYRSGDKEITLCDREPMDGEDCERELIHHATLAAQEVYKEYRDSVMHTFEDLFTARCMAGAGDESMTMNYNDSEHHYTLYYYDQAGNLVRTIPPEGVEPVDESLWAQINSDRINGNRSVYTRHRMETRYLYNSLNQLVAQYMPDHEKMEAFSAGATGSGLPVGMKVVSSEFLNGNQGVLFGENPQNPDQSLIYTTSDGGQSWQKANIAGLNHLNDISIVDNDVAYIAGNGGTLLKTGDGGDSWTARGSGTTEDLIAICMKSETDGYFFSRNKIYHFNGTGSGISFSMPAGETLTGAWFKNPSMGYAVGYAGNGGIIYQTENGGTSWTKLTPEILASKITYVQLLSGGNGYALDANGMLLRTNNSGQTWLPVHINADEQPDFSKIQFMDNVRGWAITRDQRLLYTDNSGSSWQLAGTQMKDFWMDGANLCLLAGTGEISGLVTGETVAGAEHIYVDNDTTCYAWNDNTIYQKKKGEDWTSQTTSGKIRKLSSVPYQGETIVIGLTEQNNILLAFSSGEAGSLPANFTPVDMTVKGSSIYLLSSTGKTTVSSDGGASWAEPGANGIPSATGAFDIADDNNRILIAGDDGRIYRTMDGISIDKGEILQPERLQAVHAGNSITVAAGNNGTILWNTGQAEWRLRKLPANENLYAVQVASGNGVMAAGSGGNIFECPGLNDRPFHIRETVDDRSTVHAIAASGNVLLSGTASGRLDKVQGITCFPNPTGEGGINALRIRGNTAFAVGDGGVIYKLNNMTTSSSWTRHEGNDVYPSVITA